MAQPQFRAWNNPANDPGQTLHTHEDPAYFETNLISEDFGPRRLGQNPYDWHGGIDYNGAHAQMDFGYLLLALEGGTISQYSQMLIGTKSVVIEGENYLRYVHVFTGGIIDNEYLMGNPNGMPTGSCLLKAMDSPNDDLDDLGGMKWAIVVRDNGNYTARWHIKSYRS